MIKQLMSNYSSDTSARKRYHQSIQFQHSPGQQVAVKVLVPACRTSSSQPKRSCKCIESAPGQLSTA